jgi:hypothetical protein
MSEHTPESPLSVDKSSNSLFSAYNCVGDFEMMIAWVVGWRCHPTYVPDVHGSTWGMSFFDTPGSIRAIEWRRNSPIEWRRVSLNKNVTTYLVEAPSLDTNADIYHMPVDVRKHVDEIMEDFPNYLFSISNSSDIFTNEAQ